ncbi:hypothetical protein Pan14r_21210 [Crateriforma conspicua]|uniref:Uncharacterized protein n=1 Tax=Crateriforma conspicua TaxID=2527996 RepID=A0A5C5Y6E0_9PLAN|nr:hypothetical protein Pan14r_21210 [Crateriforma conspicua]
MRIEIRRLPQCNDTGRAITNGRFPHRALFAVTRLQVSSKGAHKKIELTPDPISQISKRFDLCRFDAAVMDERRAVS